MTQPLMAVSRRTRSTPYSRRVNENGVKGYSVYNRTLIPTQFRETLEEDYWHLRQHVQLWDVTCERQVQIKGPDAAKLVQMMTPRNLSKMVVGKCVYAPLVDEKGGMINDPVVLKIEEDCFWLSLADSDILLWAMGLAKGYGFDVDVSEPDVFPLAVQGPKAEELVARIFGEEIREIGFFRFKFMTFKGATFPVARSGWSKQGGFELYLNDPTLGEDLWDALWDAGQDLEVGPGCPNLIERIEGALFSYGNDFTSENNLLECGLDAFCSIDGDFDFIGKEALLSIREKGIKRRIRGIRFDDNITQSCQDLWTVTVDGKFAGHVTSAANSPALGVGIANGMIEIDYCETGQAVSIETPNGTLSAVICDIPFEVPAI